MTIFQVILIILFLLSPLLIILIPFIVAWRKGKKKLDRAHKKYEKAITLSLQRLLKIPNIKYEKTSDLEASFYANNHIAIQGKVWLVDRRYYFYYIASIWKPLSDAINMEIALDKIPGLALLIVSKNQTKLIQQAMAYAEELEVANIEGLSRYLILTDDLYALRKILSPYIINEINNLYPSVLYILLDYGTPNITIFAEINEKNYHVLIPRIFNLLKMIITNLGKIPPKKTKVEVLRRIRKTFGKIAMQRGR